MAVAGIPQFMIPRVFIWSGSGSPNEVDVMGLNGLDKLSGTVYAQSNSSCIITGGPTTTGPIIVSENGVTWALPFNASFSAPSYVHGLLDPSQGWVKTAG